MAHVQIPAREDVDPTAIHHSGVSLPPLSFCGEGCDVEQLDTYSFKIRVTQPAFEAMTNITDLSDVMQHIERMDDQLDFLTVTSKHQQSDVERLQDELLNCDIQTQSNQATIERIQTEIDFLTANLHAARQRQNYFALSALFATIFSLLAVGLAVWN